MAKVTPGSPLSIPARDWNTLLDVAELHRRGELATLSNGLIETQPGRLINIRNNTGDTLPRYNSVGIGAPFFSPTENLQTFLNQLGFVGEGLSSAYAGLFAVVQETLPAGKIGRAVFAGITVAQIDVVAADHDYADAGSSATLLTSGDSGGARILYKEGGTGTKWAIIRIPAEAVNLWYIGKVKTAAIAAESSGTVVQHNYDWTSAGTDFTVYNPHDIELPVGWKVRWSKYPGWTSCGTPATDWIVEPWQFTECPPD